MQAEIQELAENWWAFVIRGVIAVLFAIAAFSYPGLTLVILTVFFGAFVLVDGVVSLVMAFGNKRWFWYLISGLVSIAAGIVAFMYPGMTAIILVIIIGAWAFVGGISQIIAAIQLRKEIEGEWFLILSGIVSVLFGLFVMFRPGGGALAVSWLIAFYALFFGLMHIFLGFRLKGLKKSGSGGAAQASA